MTEDEYIKALKEKLLECAEFIKDFSEPAAMMTGMNTIMYNDVIDTIELEKQINYNTTLEHQSSTAYTHTNACILAINEYYPEINLNINEDKEYYKILLKEFKNCFSVGAGYGFRKGYRDKNKENHKEHEDTRYGLDS